MYNKRKVFQTLDADVVVKINQSKSKKPQLF